MSDDAASLGKLRLLYLVAALFSTKRYDVAGDDELGLARSPSLHQQVELLEIVEDTAPSIEFQAKDRKASIVSVAHDSV